MHSDFGWTVILISNDPMIMDAVNRVVIMRNGTITEEGAFRNLAATNADLQELIRDYNII
jgi:ABC-type transport system involved in cytochrome bd biosynthesis fused ATPase/permease subunit